MVRLEETYERDAIKQLRQRAKAMEKPVIPGRFYVLHITPEGGKNHIKVIRYALAEEHATAKVRKEYPGCSFHPVINSYDYWQAQHKLTGRVGCLSALLNAQDCGELRDDLRAWEGTREPVVIRPQAHGETQRIIASLKGKRVPPAPNEEGTMTLAEFVTALRENGFDIRASQLDGIWRRHLPLTAKITDDRNRRYSDADLSLMKRFLQHHNNGKYVRKDAEQPA